MAYKSNKYWNSIWYYNPMNLIEIIRAMQFYIRPFKALLFGGNLNSVTSNRRIDPVQRTCWSSAKMTKP